MAVYEIRKQLGENVIESRGDDLVLDTSEVHVDLDAFDEAMDRGDVEEAVDRYTGPFLDGVHLGGSAAFDRWVEEARYAVGARYRRALELLAEARASADDPTGAVDAWRKLAAVDRYNSRVALRLLDALVAAGNRAGALQFARVHAALLEQEFGTEPSAEFTAAVEKLHESPPARGEAVEEPETVTPTPTPIRAEGPGSSAGDSSPDVTQETPGDALHRSGGRQLVHSDSVVVAPDEGRRVPRIVVGALLVVGLIGSAVGLGAWLLTEPSDTVSIAVLPFEGTGSIDEEERSALMYGLTVETLEALSQVEGVRVPVQSAVFALRGEDAREAARSLGVEYVIGGTFRASGDSLRINVDLSDARGFNEWSEQYERRRGDVFQISEEIAVAVLDAVRFRLGDVDPDRRGRQPVPMAAESFWKGRAAWLERTPAGFQRALSYYERATKEDPLYAEAYAAIADVYNLMGAYDYGMMPPETAYPLAREAAVRALAIDPTLSEAHAALAMTTFAHDRAWDAAEALFRDALELDDRNAQAHHWYGLFLATHGRMDEAMEAVDRALALDSLSPIMHTSRARQHYFRGRYELARAGYERALNIDGSFFIALHGLGLVLVQQGRYDQALRTYRRAIELLGGRAPPTTLALMGNAYGNGGQPDSARAILARLDGYRAAGAYVPPEYDAIVHLGLGNLEAATEGLRRAYRAGSSAVAYYRLEPILAPLRGFPPFEALCDSAGIPDPGYRSNRTRLN